jgi:hypothetical protein
MATAITHHPILNSENIIKKRVQFKEDISINIITEFYHVNPKNKLSISKIKSFKRDVDKDSCSIM